MEDESRSPDYGNHADAYGGESEPDYEVGGDEGDGYESLDSDGDERFEIGEPNDDDFADDGDDQILDSDPLGIDRDFDRYNPQGF